MVICDGKVARTHFIKLIEGFVWSRTVGVGGVHIWALATRGWAVGNVITPGPDDDKSFVSTSTDNTLYLPPNFGMLHCGRTGCATPSLSPLTLERTPNILLTPCLMGRLGIVGFLGPTGPSKLAFPRLAPSCAGLEVAPCIGSLCAYRDLPFTG